MLLILVVYLATLVEGTPVLNGKDVQNKEKYPFLVHLEFSETVSENDENVVNCGGVLINLDVVLTAAHCFTILVTEPTVRVAGGILHRSLDTPVAVTFGKEYLIHEEYMSLKTEAFLNKTTFQLNDIALLWLRDPFHLSSRLKLANLIGSKLNIMGEVGKVVGWGLTNKGRGSEILQEGNLRVFDRGLCGEIHDPLRVSENMLCAKADNNKTCNCIGDSGGPFIINNKVAGIGSWGGKLTMREDREIITCDPTKPSVYTSVKEYKPWIKENVMKGPPTKRVNRKIGKENIDKIKFGGVASKLSCK